MTSNPCARVKPPKKNKKEAVYLEKEDVEKLLIDLEHEELVYIALIQLYLFTGMRRGEALGLTWRDINFEKNLIDINKERIYVHNQGVIVDTPKNETSVRVIKVPTCVMELLKAWKEQQNKNRLIYGDMYFVSDWVFTNILGKPFHSDSISSWFRNFIDKNNLPKIHLHSLRHTNASLLIASGIDIKTVSKRLGHSNVQTTGVIYTHQLRMADETAADTLELLFDKKSSAANA
ncbi:MAG: site-specific integrase [Oscillospiraceae bacterium]|nr:site-specific integrase [Oscillospiraceae bacterium]